MIQVLWEAKRSKVLTTLPFHSTKALGASEDTLMLVGYVDFSLFFSIAKLISTGQRRTTASHLHIPQPWRCYPEKGTAAFTCL
jgi:hypothetical protein